MTGLCALLKVLLIISCFAALTSGAAKRRKRSPHVPKSCQYQAVEGPCRAMIKRYYYNVDKRECEEFNYGGCEGNSNSFESQEKCERKCKYQGGRERGT